MIYLHKVDNMFDSGIELFNLFRINSTLISFVLILFKSIKTCESSDDVADVVEGVKDAERLSSFFGYFILLGFLPLLTTTLVAIAVVESEWLLSSALFARAFGSLPPFLQQYDFQSDIALKFQQNVDNMLVSVLSIYSPFLRTLIEALLDSYSFFDLHIFIFCVGRSMILIFYLFSQQISHNLLASVLTI